MSIGTHAMKGVFWSLVQNWGSKFFTFVIFVVLARFLTPAQYGTASAAYMIILLAGLVAEFGFSDAVVQRRNLENADVNLPFFVSLVVASTGSIVCILLARNIEGWLNIPGLAPVVVASSGLLPLTTLSLFQEMNYRRNLRFRDLALRVLIANFIAGIIALICAFYGLGVWSLVIQNYLLLIIGMAWLWARPVWKPTFELRNKTFIELGRFGVSVATMRLMDFAAVRLVDVIIVHKFGVIMLGLYAVGSRLYLVLMQLLQSALNDVSLTVLSKISHEKERMAAIYMQAIVLAAFIASPVFVCSAALSQEICAVLFGEKWSGVDHVALPLLLLGAIQCVQYLNGAYLSARGRPYLVLMSATVKYSGMVLGLLVIPSHKVGEVVSIFAMLQLLATPISFYTLARELSVKLITILVNLMPSILGSLMGFILVTLLRPLLQDAGFNVLLNGFLLGVTFLVGYVGTVALCGRRQVQMIITFINARRGRNP